MTELAIVIQRYSAWLYFLLTALMLRQIQLMWRAGREHGTSLFGLEREAATGKAVRALVSLFLYGTIGVGVYTLTTGIDPSMSSDRGGSGVSPAILRPPPTAEIATDTPTPLPYTPTPPPVQIVTRTPEGG